MSNKLTPQELQEMRDARELNADGSFQSYKDNIDKLLSHISEQGEEIERLKVVSENYPVLLCHQHFCKSFSSGECNCGMDELWDYLEKIHKSDQGGQDDEKG